MPSGQNDRRNEVFRLTEFRGFTDSFQGASALADRFLRILTLQNDSGLVPFTADVNSAGRGVAIAETLLEQRCELDAHCGWKLAADAALVYKFMESTIRVQNGPGSG